MPYNEKDFLAFRELFPAYGQGVYMNHAAVSPMSTITKSALDDFWERRSHIPVDVFPGIMDTLGNLKEMICRLIHAGGKDEIAFVPNTGSGLGMFATSLKWKEGDRVILNTMEFPANIYPFLNLERLGVNMDWVQPVDGQIRVEDIEAQVTPRTRMIAISFVQFLNGFKADLKAIGKICKKNNIIFVVDGIQGVGAVPLDVQKCHIDVFVTAGHKWLMWPMGTGFMYVRKEFLPQCHPVLAGWLSVKNSWDLFDYQLDFLDSAERFQTGTLNFMGFYVAHDMLKRFLELKIEHIYTRITGITQRLMDGLRELNFPMVTPGDPAFRSGIVSIKMAEPEKVMKHLEEQNIHIALREGVLRFAPHCTNTPEDVDRVLDSLKNSSQ